METEVAQREHPGEEAAVYGADDVVGEVEVLQEGQSVGEFLHRGAEVVVGEVKGHGQVGDFR